MVLSETASSDFPSNLCRTEAIDMIYQVNNPQFLDKLLACSREACLVCHNLINIRRDPGLQMTCGHWQCEGCSELLAEHCSICHREDLNRSLPCPMCEHHVLMYQTRTCVDCEQLCCVHCTERTFCCIRNPEDSHDYCYHARCVDCVSDPIVEPMVEW